MFKLRPGGQGGSGPVQTPSIDSIRRQARHRLIGASVLVLVGVIGLPWLFDTQPRPVPVDITIDIPAKDRASPLAPPEEARRPPAVSVAQEREEVLAPSRPPAEPPAPVAAPEPAPAPSGGTTATTAAAASKVPVTPAGPPAPAAPAPVVRPAPVPAPSTPVTPPAPEAARAQALLEGRTPPSGIRVVVQVGAFAEQARAQEVRLRLERAGLKTYTQVAQTADGPRIRVRVGPFDTRAEAERVAEQVKQLGLPASILTL